MTKMFALSTSSDKATIFKYKLRARTIRQKDLLLPGIAETLYGLIKSRLDRFGGKDDALIEAARKSFKCASGSDYVMLCPKSSATSEDYARAIKLIRPLPSYEAYMDEIAEAWIYDRSYEPYIGLRNFTFKQMVDNSGSKEVEELRNVWKFIGSECFDNMVMSRDELGVVEMLVTTILSNYTGVLVSVANKFRAYGSFDLKNLDEFEDLKNKHIDRDFITIEGDDRYVYPVDFFGNIHYGYVLSSAIPTSGRVMRIGNLAGRLGGRVGSALKFFLGRNDRSDDVAMQAGIKLWKTNGSRLTESSLDAAIKNIRHGLNRKEISYGFWGENRFRDSPAIREYIR